MTLAQLEERTATLETLKDILDSKQIKNEIVDSVHTYNNEPYRYIQFSFPVARDSDTIRVNDDDNIGSIIATNFDKYRGITNYEAIWSSELKKIECMVQDASKLPARYILGRLSNIFTVCEETENGFGRTEPSKVLLFSDNTINVYLGFSSKEFAFIHFFKDGMRRDLDDVRTFFRLTLQIENISAESEEDARNKLEKISNTLFYQLDNRYDFCLTLSSRRESMIDRRKKNQHKQVDWEHHDFTLDYMYDEVPISLYWFAQTNTHSPIFMYFALYQALEFYFPIYATKNVKNTIQSIIKDPKFKVTRDADITKIINVIKSSNPNSFGDEREQLSITLKSVVSGEEIIDFIKDNTHIEEYLKSKDCTKIAEKKPRLNDTNGILDDLAERIYDIRCRIVHNKASETDKKILPMTKNVNYLKNEVELLKFIVRKVLIANSSPFSLK